VTDRERPVIHVAPDAERVAHRAADVMANHINDALARSAAVHIALAGGSTPRRAYELLAEMQGSWGEVHLWLGDERCVPEDDPESNTRMVRESLLDRLRAPSGPHLHHVRGELGPEDAAWLYACDIVRAMGERPVFDLVLLGLGPDGHTASLFPGSPALDADPGRLVTINQDPTGRNPFERMTLTFSGISRGRLVVFTVAGADKRDAMQAIADGADLPAARVRADRVLWLVDPDAAPR
jgi:6-phosphogluconolactonase